MYEWRLPRPGMILSIIGGDDDDEGLAASKQYTASPEQKKKLAKVWSFNARLTPTAHLLC